MMSLKLRADRKQLNRRNQRKIPRKRRLLTHLLMMLRSQKADKSQLSKRKKRKKRLLTPLSMMLLSPRGNRIEVLRSKKEEKEEKVADSFVNDVAESEGRQDRSAEVEKDDNKEESKENDADSLIKDIGRSDGKQEPDEEDAGNDTNEKHSDSTAQAGKSPEQLEDTNL